MAIAHVILFVRWAKKKHLGKHNQVEKKKRCEKKMTEEAIFWQQLQHTLILITNNNTKHTHVFVLNSRKKNNFVYRTHATVGIGQRNQLVQEDFDFP
jgi:hypothetical protein